MTSHQEANSTARRMLKVLLDKYPPSSNLHSWLCIIYATLAEATDDRHTTEDRAGSKAQDNISTVGTYQNTITDSISS